MRDYKNVKVPRSYRSKSNRVTIKRVGGGHFAGRTGKGGAGIKQVALRIIAIVVIAAGGWLGWQGYQMLLHAEMFQIAGIDVKGVKQVSEADLREIASVFTGQNIFRVDLETAVRRVRANPWVNDVRIYRRLPNRISMDVAERVAFALLDTGSSQYVMDSEGVVIDKIVKTNGSAWPLPVVVVRDYRARSGEQVTSESMADALTLISEIAARGGWPMQEVTIKAGSSESLSVLYADHEFKFGAGNYAEKLNRLGEILAEEQRRGLEFDYVDLRSDRMAAVMVKKDRVQGSGSRGQGKKI